MRGQDHQLLRPERQTVRAAQQRQPRTCDVREMTPCWLTPPPPQRRRSRVPRSHGTPPASLDGGSRENQKWKAFTRAPLEREESGGSTAAALASGTDGSTTGATWTQSRPPFRRRLARLRPRFTGAVPSRHDAGRDRVGRRAERVDRSRAGPRRACGGCRRPGTAGMGAGGPWCRRAARAGSGGDRHAGAGAAVADDRSERLRPRR